MKTLFLLATLFQRGAAPLPPAELVWMCTGPHSNSYHFSKDCAILKQCTREVRTVRLVEARKVDMYQCNRCWRERSPASSR